MKEIQYIPIISKKSIASLKKFKRSLKKTHKAMVYFEASLKRAEP